MYYYDFLLEKRTHNPSIKTVVNTIQNLLLKTTFTKKKNDPKIEVIIILELVADLLNTTDEIMNFLSDELLFEKS